MNSSKQTLYYSIFIVLAVLTGRILAPAPVPAKADPQAQEFSATEAGVCGVDQAATPGCASKAPTDLSKLPESPVKKLSEPVTKEPVAFRAREILRHLNATKPDSNVSIADVAITRMLNELLEFSKRQRFSDEELDAVAIAGEKRPNTEIKVLALQILLEQGGSQTPLRIARVAASASAGDAFLVSRTLRAAALTGGLESEAWVTFVEQSLSSKSPAFVLALSQALEPDDLKPEDVVRMCNWASHNTLLRTDHTLFQKVRSRLLVLGESTGARLRGCI